MSGLTSVRSYFRTQLNALEYKEWKGGFNIENIPSTILDGSYHIETISAQRRGAFDQQKQDVEVPVTIRTFIKGYRNPAEAIDDAMSECDSITARVLDPTRRLGAAIKNIYFSDMKITPLAVSNDNAAILEIMFNCFIIFS